MSWEEILKVKPYERAVAREFASEDMKVGAKCKHCDRVMYVPNNPNQHQKCIRKDCPVGFQNILDKEFPKQKRSKNKISRGHWNDEEEGP